MRFDQLVMQKYGAYTNMSVELGSGPGLVVVYGPNEAGKSTWLEAISDFLFGIPAKTARGSVHGYKGMSLEASIRFSDGAPKALTRNKGKSGTLLESGGGNAGERQLAAALGPLTRERFRVLFGLDHASLRAGGAQLLSANGEIGRIILEAGGGLRALVRSMDALREESSDLLGRSKQSTLRALAGKLKEVEAQLKELRLTVKGYDEQRAACTSAEVELDMLRGTLARVLKEQSRQQRIMRVHPSLVELVAVEAELANLTDLQTLSPRFAEELADARRNVEEGKKHRAEAQKQYDHIEAELSDLRCNDALLAEERRAERVNEFETPSLQVY